MRRRVGGRSGRVGGVCVDVGVKKGGGVKEGGGGSTHEEMEK